ncbi:MAG TPA: YigZ family protein [Syntrophomonadaceae bacterium]|nr:YigZ family protein [Syntrophomonadaceae bacterium]
MYYYSVGHKATKEIVIRKSRFIGFISPVMDEVEAENLLIIAKERWPQARHYCYAYILHEQKIERYSDDGEPSGTAGVPILSVLRNNSLENVMLIVTRYFGGTLLGAPGLVRAYSQTASLVIQATRIKKLELCIQLRVKCDYTYWDNIEHKLLQKGVLIEHIDYLEKVIAHIYCPVEKEEYFKDQIISFSNGSAEIITYSREYKSLS